MAIIELESLCFRVRKHFWTPQKTLLQDVSLAVEPGEVFGFLGPNGAGKTTTIKVLLGLLRPDSGRARLFGEAPGTTRVRRRLGFMPERAYFPEHLSGRELLLGHGLLAGLGLADAKKRADEVLELVGLGAAKDEPLRTHSKGMLQRAGLAQALVGRPELVVLDEPMSGLDPIGRRDMREIMLRLKQEGRTVFFSTHILPDVEALCDRVAIMVGGTVRKVGRIEDLLGDTTAGVEVVATGGEAQALAALGTKARSFTRRGDAAVFEVEDQARANALCDELRRLGATLVSLQPLRRTLEEVFVREAGRGEVA